MWLSCEEASAVYSTIQRIMEGLYVSWDDIANLPKEALVDIVFHFNNRISNIEEVLKIKDEVKDG